MLFTRAMASPLKRFFSENLVRILQWLGITCSAGIVALASTLFGKSEMGIPMIVLGVMGAVFNVVVMELYAKQERKRRIRVKLDSAFKKLDTRVDEHYMILRPFYSLKGEELTLPPAFVPRGDSVYFSVSSARTLAPSRTYHLDVWAHLEEQAEELTKRARQAADSEEVRIRTEGPVELERGSSLTVRLSVPKLTVNPKEKSLIWNGKIANAGFLVAVPENCQGGQYPGRAKILFNGLTIAELAFILEVGAEDVGRDVLKSELTHIRHAFASYASEDRADVLARLQ
jgi:hypothetical protein